MDKQAVDKRRHGGAAAAAMPAALREVFFCISRAFYAYIARLEELLVKNDLAEHVRPGMGHVLFALFEQDDVIIKNLVQRTELSPSALTRILGDMERRRLITRHRDKSDRRATRVRLTRHARSLEARCNQTLAEVHRIICGEMRERDIKAVVHGLTQMIRNLRGQERPMKDTACRSRLRMFDDARRRKHSAGAGASPCDRGDCGEGNLRGE
jgi:DNA-binding MarR family transcriptional regulator